MKLFPRNKTFAEAAALPSSHPRIILTIEGFGNSEGLYRFCDQKPAYATGSLYRPLLTAFPNELVSEIDPLGGIGKAAQITFSLLDEATSSADPGLITLSLGSEERAVGYLSGSSNAVLSSSGTLLYVNASGTIQSGSVYFIDGEAVRATSTNTSTLSATIERGWLGTQAQRHPFGTKVFRQNPVSLGRKVSYYLGFDELSGQSEERLLGTFFITDYQPSKKSHFNEWSFKATSRHDWFNRRVAGNIRFQGKVGTNGGNPLKIVLNSVRDNLLNGVLDVDNLSIWGNNKMFVRIGGELLQATLATHLGIIYLYPDGQNVLCDSPPDERGFNTEVRQVLISEVSSVAQGATEIESSFRVQDPGLENSNGASDPNWRKTDNPIDILLCVLTSPSSADDGLFMTNYSSGFGNWSCLPHGWGIGVPAENIDFGSFLEVRERIRNVELPYLVIDESEPFGEWVEKNILIPFGLLLDISNDKITLKKPKVFSSGFAPSSITEDNILMENKSIGVDFEIITNDIYSRVRYWRKARNGNLTEIIVKDSDFPSLFKVDNLSTFSNKTIDIEVPGMSTSRDGSQYLIEDRAISILSRVHRPYVVVSFMTDLSFYSLDVGDVIDLTVRHLPKPGKGRGFSAESAQIISKKFCLDPKGRVGIAWSVVWFNNARSSLVCPSLNVYTTTNGGTRFYGDRNRYCASGTGDFATYLPGTDQAGFTVGDAVRGRFRDGTDIAAGVIQTITGITADHIRLDGNFAGQDGDVAVLEYAYFEEQVQQQRDDFCSLGNNLSGRIQSSGTLLVYGDV